MRCGSAREKQATTANRKNAEEDHRENAAAAAKGRRENGSRGLPEKSRQQIQANRNQLPLGRRQACLTGVSLMRPIARLTTRQANGAKPMPALTMAYSHNQIRVVDRSPASQSAQRNARLRASSRSATRATNPGLTYDGSLAASNQISKETTFSLGSEASCRSARCSFVSRSPVRRSTAPPPCGGCGRFACPGRCCADAGNRCGRNAVAGRRF